jgi:hypothetical protein
MAKPYGTKCPNCGQHRTKIVDLKGDGDDLVIVMGCEDCQSRFNGNEAPKDDHGDPWWIGLEDDFTRQFEAYLAQFSGE